MEYDELAKQVIEELAAILKNEPIQTSRLRLRPFRESDLPDLYEYLSQPEQRRLSGNCEVNDLGDARLVLDRILDPANPHRSFAIILKAEDKVIGNLSLGRYPFLDGDPVLRELRGVSLSYVLNERCWRRGFMTELLRAVYPVLFEKGDLAYIQSGYFAFNTASAALQKKLGMRLWTEEEIEINGEKIQTKEMILFREDFARNGGFRG
jgi:RimJ/RimL family protein N-acetyltransferase